MGRALCSLQAWQGALSQTHGRRARRQETTLIKQMFKDADTDSSGALDSSQLKQFMQDYLKNHEVHGLTDKTVSDAEVK